MDKTLLPPCDALYRTFFYGWCDEDAQRRHPDRVRADLEQLELGGKTTVTDLHPLPESERGSVEQRIAQMVEAARLDIGRLVGARPPLSLDWLRATDVHLDRGEVHTLMKSSKPSNYTNNFLVFACELGALIAHVLRQEHPGFVWLYDQPYWESSLLDPDTGLRVYPFHWAMRKLSEDGVDDDVAEKVLGCKAWLAEHAPGVARERASPDRDGSSGRRI